MFCHNRKKKKEVRGWIQKNQTESNRGNKGNYSWEPVEQKIIGTAAEERRKTYKEKRKH